MMLLNLGVGVFSAVPAGDLELGHAVDSAESELAPRAEGEEFESTTLLKGFESGRESTKGACLTCLDSDVSPPAGMAGVLSTLRRAFL
jgi:hypothetical protein